jgi:hypothetical protein
MVEKESTAQKIKRLLTSKPAIVIYGVVVLGLGTVVMIVKARNRVTKHIKKETDPIEENPNVRCTQKGNIINYSLIPIEVPEIKIQECAQCGRKALRQCNQCILTYYCSPECQNLNGLQHKAICKEIEKAQFGDIAHMRNIFSAYMKKASETANKQFIKEGLSWHLRIIVRLRQDVACSKDLSTQSSIDHVQWEHGQLINHLIVERNICSEEELENINKELFKDALAWVKEKTREKKLVPPFNIRRYGLKAFMNAQINVDEEFIPEKKWNEQRMAVIQKYEKDFEIS